MSKNRFWEKLKYKQSVSFRENGKDYRAVLVGDDPHTASSWRIVSQGEEFTPTPEYLYHVIPRKRSLKLPQEEYLKKIQSAPGKREIKIE